MQQKFSVYLTVASKGDLYAVLRALRNVWRRKGFYLALCRVVRFDAVLK